ncbi:MAG: response regulator [Nitrospinota bacterium]
MADKKTILIVDDEAFIQRSLQFVLKKTGHKIVTAADGDQAIEKAKAAKPDLIFLDIMMPKKDGFEVLKELREDDELKDVHVIMLTGKGRDQDRQKGMDLGANDFLTKPFVPSQLFKMAKQILG